MEIHKHCIDCGKSFISTSHIQIRCKECQVEYHRKMCAEYMRNKSNRHPQTECTQYYFTILRDPLDIIDGGFEPGSKLPTGHLEYMLKLGSFTPGTLIERNGKKYQIKGKKLVEIFDKRS